MAFKISPVNLNFPQQKGFMYVVDQRLQLPKRAVFSPNQVNQAIWRGANPSPEDMKALSELGIKTILNLRTISHKEILMLKTEALKHGIEYVNIPLNPFKIKPYIDNILEVINQASPKNPLFIHCTFGRDRTGFVVALARHVKEGMPIPEAIAEMCKNGFRKFAFYPMLNYLRKFKK